jgi:murein DD-endopeptidase MepM/ murein hydrolase activator NlpD
MTKISIAASVAAATLCFSVHGAAQAATPQAPDAKAAQQTGQRAMGGPFEALDSNEASVDLQTDQQFRSLFMTWKKLDTLEQSVIAIPSAQPVERLSFTSNYGVRSDPFRGTAAMHAGVDIPGPVGTPVYATADYLNNGNSGMKMTPVAMGGPAVASAD